MLKKVTITGIDEETSEDKVRQITEKYPFVEWGTLFSYRQGSSPRFPPHSFIKKFQGLPLSAHLCGQWAKNASLLGDFNFADTDIFPLFQRIQFNFSPYLYKVNTSSFMKLLSKFPGKQYIFQMGKSSNCWDVPEDFDGVFFHDSSGGRGVSPKIWKPPMGKFCGYSGGLGPENIKDELPKILQAAGESDIWVDMESKVRTDDWLDLEKVENCLRAAGDFTE